MLLKTLSECSASRLALRGTRVFPLLLKQFSPKLETEATLGLLIKLIGGETDAGEPRPAWVDEGARDGDHAQVRPPLYLISGAALLVTIRSSIRIIYACRLCSDVEIMCSIRQRYDALATSRDAGSASSAHVLTLLISAHKNRSPHVPPARRLYLDARSGGTCDRLSIALSRPNTPQAVSWRWWRRLSAGRCQTSLG
jgi:hypothetical protein